VLGVDRARRWLCGQAEGDVLEIGIGTGRGLPYYSTSVRLTGVDLTPGMLDIARARALRLGLSVELRVGDAQTLEFPPERFDTVVIALALCSIPNDRLSISEVSRVTRPGGRLLIMEHVRRPNPVVRAGQRTVEPMFVRFQADHLTREPLEHIEEHGFAVERVDRCAWGIMERVVARRKG
jgi:ubiquinone/menaquinone biosynthesis C-methylase UbiE